MRSAPAALTLLALALALSACSSPDLSRCFEPNGMAYAVHAPGDTAFVSRWTGEFMPVRVYAESVGTLRTNVSNGLALWGSAFRCGEIQFVLWSDSATADIVVRNPPGQPPAPAPGASLGVGDSVNACRGRTDVIPDSTDPAHVYVSRPVRSYVWPITIDSVALASCYHFVTAHELGHALGLYSHSPDANDLMYALPGRTVLSTDDRFTVQVLYHIDPTVSAKPR